MQWLRRCLKDGMPLLNPKCRGKVPPLSDALFFSRMVQPGGGSPKDAAFATQGLSDWNGWVDPRGRSESPCLSRNGGRTGPSKTASGRDDSHEACSGGFEGSRRALRADHPGTCVFQAF